MKKLKEYIISKVNTLEEEDKVMLQALAGVLVIACLIALF